MLVLCLLVWTLSNVQDAGAQEKPWRLADALDAPDWLKIEGETRIRYESVAGQFRAGGRGGDQVVGARTLALIEVDTGRVALGIEAQDARAWQDDAGTPLSGSNVNPLDILQAYARIDFGNDVPLFEDASLKLGRQSFNFGSQRIIERTEMGNVIASFTGAYWSGETARGDDLHALYVVPVGDGAPTRTELDHNDIVSDREHWGRRLWGVHYVRQDTFGNVLPRMQSELYLYGLRERDTGATLTPNRDYLEPGVRLFRAPEIGQWDLDVETSMRFGTRRATSLASDTRDLDVHAHRMIARIGYTFENDWRTRLAFDIDVASGDENPTDARFDQYERLFGSRRTDLGATGIFGPLVPANLIAPGARIEVAPSRRTDARLVYKAAYLNEARDAWVGANVRDTSGQSGKFIGHALDARVRTWIIPDALRFEVGAAALIRGDFAKRAPNAAATGDSSFGYVQLSHRF
jgi:hypothetical protein